MSSPKQPYQALHLEQHLDFKIITPAISPMIGGLTSPNPLEVLDMQDGLK